MKVRVISLLIAVSLIFGLAACGNGEKDGGNPTGTTAPGTTAGAGDTTAAPTAAPTTEATVPEPTSAPTKDPTVSVEDGIQSRERYIDESAIDGEKLTEAINKLIIESKFTPGYSMAVSKGGKIIYKDYQGNQNFVTEEGQKAYDKDTILEVQSVTKPIIATLIFKCAEDGLLNVNDTVKTYAPEMFFDDVTIYNLLTHSGGYSAAELNKKVRWNGRRDSLPRYIEKIYQFDKRAFEPGTSSQYYDGYIMLMDIVERVTGKPIEEYAQEVLFKPLNMTSTHMDERLLDVDRFITVNNYNIKTKKDDLVKGAETRPCIGNAGLFTTVDDIMNFTLMIKNKGSYNGVQILKKETVEEMVTECKEPNFSRTPAFFLNVGPTMGTFGKDASFSTVGHLGYSGTSFSVDFDNDITCVFLSNNSSNLTVAHSYQDIKDAFTLMYQHLR